MILAPVSYFIVRNYDHSQLFETYNACQALFKASLIKPAGLSQLDCYSKRFVIIMLLLLYFLFQKVRLTQSANFVH